ncbi:TerD family protein [Novosphingobium sp. TCA1]|uniref:TerD family protein n=1 Tax=Novosphingobium sp. TCA1 TaxID=2682474 RepID=UPI001308FE93|nr:TerD family protein [Novosphingobium sp. TCA1]GFE77320.1 tellurium resistance protein TerA [Novosphingobium sp. TCA1]
MQLQRGEKRGLSDLGIQSQCTVKIDFGLDGVDIAAFGLNQAKQIGDDRYVVLFSNTSTPEGAVRLTPYSDTASFNLDLDKLPSSIDRLIFTATHDTRPISDARPLVVSVDGNKALFNVAEHLTTEKAVMMCEIYRHSSGWKLGTIAAGFAGGLAALITHFGGEVADTPPPTPPPAPAPVSLKKITLEKSNSTVSLKKTGASFGEIILNLNWNQNTSRGFFGGTKQLDLDLGVIFEMQDGYAGVIQALGRTFGDFNNEPYIELSGDDRTGAVAAGETIRVNGRHFDQIKKLGVFALIYDGAPNWQQTDGVVRMNMPGQPEIEIRMNEGRNDKRLCGVALIENVNGELQMKRHMKYYPSQKGFADDIGIFLNWVGATKD